MRCSNVNQKVIHDTSKTFKKPFKEDMEKVCNFNACQSFQTW